MESVIHLACPTLISFTLLSQGVSLAKWLAHGALITMEATLAPIATLPSMEGQLVILLNQIVKTVASVSYTMLLVANIILLLSFTIQNVLKGIMISAAAYANQTVAPPQ